jgi:iron complex transport system substrate-binding protein
MKLGQTITKKNLPTLPARPGTLVATFFFSLLFLIVFQTLCLQGLKAQGKVTLEREGYPMAFQNGNKVITFERRPSRILALGLGATELLIELGLAEMVVGRTSEWPEEICLPKYAQALASIPEVDDDNILSIVTDNNGPDFIYGLFMPSTPEPAFVKTYRVLAHNKHQYFREVRDLAKILMAEDNARALLTDQDMRLAILSSRLADADRDTVLVIFGLNGDSLLSSGGPDFASEILRLAGSRNVFDDLGLSPPLTTQEAASRDPDYILVVDDGISPLTEKIIAIKADPVLSPLAAVAGNRVLTIHESFLLPGPRIADSAELLAKQIHPSLAH